MDLKNWIRDVPDFPKPGIMFRDISPLLADHKAWHAAVDRLAEIIAPHKPDLLAGIESRGFLVTAPLALVMGCGFMMVRKRGKLPGRTIPFTYDLEYGSDTIEVQDDFIRPGQRVVVLDDVLATGGRRRARGGLHHRAGLPGGQETVRCPVWRPRDLLNRTFSKLKRTLGEANS
jgi:adenine phosphoribosyltransferase